MKKLILISCLLLATATSISAQQNDFPVLQGPYLGQKMPGTTPEIFAPGIVSIPGFEEFTGCFSPDKKDYYFYRFSANDEDKIYFSEVIDGKWTKPQPAAFSKGFSASQPHITLDNKSLYFGWHHPLPKGEAGNPQIPSQWVTTRTSSGWSEPKYAGQGMFVSSDREGRFYVTDPSYQYGGYLTEVTVKDGRFTSYKVLRGGMDALRHKEDMAHPEKKSGTFTDSRDSEVYQWVKIGDQLWMAENLRFKTDSGSWCWENKEENCKSRGRLYNWEAAMQAAPPGWHLPSDEEWKEMEITLGLTKEQADQEGFRVDKDSLLAGKIKRIDAWPNKYKGKPLIITNETGFSAVITGFYALDEFTHEGYTVWWTCTDDKETAWLRCIGFFDNTITRLKNPKKFAFAVRCVKNLKGVKK